MDKIIVVICSVTLWGILVYAGDDKLLGENINTTNKHTDANEEVAVELKDKKT
jgi:hypothetical protein